MRITAAVLFLPLISPLDIALKLGCQLAQIDMLPGWHYVLLDTRGLAVNLQTYFF